MIGRPWLFLILLTVLVMACSLCVLFIVSGTKSTSGQLVLKRCEMSDLEKLCNLRIYFGHQSVGEDIVSGLVEILKMDSESPLKVVENEDISAFGLGTFLHSKIGRNTRPESKIRAFARILNSASPECPDIALMKFCYVDVNGESDPYALFKSYRLALSTLQEICPRTVFVHTTVPIESAPTGVKNLIKAWAKLVLRRPGVLEANRVREEYNGLVRQTYSGKEPIFDIALSESVGPDGRQSFRGKRSEPTLLMDSRYTSDGGHLNRIGRLHLAEQLVVALSDAADLAEKRGVRVMDTTL